MKFYRGFSEDFGFEPLRPVGPWMVVRIHKHIMSGTQSELMEIPKEVVEKQKWASIVGQIVALGDACYKGEKFKDWELKPQCGDWVVFKPNPGPMIEYRKAINLFLMYDDAVNAIVDNPEYVTRD